MSKATRRYSTQRLITDVSSAVSRFVRAKSVKSERIFLFILSQRRVNGLVPAHKSPQRQMHSFPRAVYVVSPDNLVDEVFVDIDLDSSPPWHAKTIPSLTPEANQFDDGKSLARAHICPRRPNRRRSVIVLVACQIPSGCTFANCFPVVTSPPETCSRRRCVTLPT